MEEKIKRLLKISVIKSILFNKAYFGLGGVWHCYALISRDVKLSQLRGKIVSNVPLHTGCIRIGFPNVGIFDHKYQRSIWDNVWIGCRCFIAKGCNVPSGCVIAAQSKVTGVAEEENSIIGDRIRIIKSDIRWKM